jgi:Protein of unknown function (DUF2591)
MKTSELTGAALDWAVAKCEWNREEGDWRGTYRADYSADWSQGGPIIEREAITVSEGSPVVGLEWMACDKGSTHIQHGPTYLIAAMRCYVASKLGDEVDVPEGLQ